MARVTGKVSRWFEERGFGFIRVDGRAKDVFVHVSSVPGNGFRRLDPGIVVSFDIEETDKGPQATNLEYVNS